VDGSLYAGCELSMPEVDTEAEVGRSFGANNVLMPPSSRIRKEIFQAGGSSAERDSVKPSSANLLFGGWISDG
jgi:hypothetical protein